jgi:hypothetical protein
LNFNPELRGFRFWGSTSTQDLSYQIGLLCGITRHAGMREVVSRRRQNSDQPSRFRSK